MDYSYLERNSLELNMFPKELLHQFGVNGKIAGALFVAKEVQNTVAIVHGAVGCGYNYRYSARIRQFPNYRVACSNLTENDIIYGGEEKLLKCIVDVEQVYKPDLILVIPSPVSDIIQDDLFSVSKKAKDLYGIRIVVAQSDGFSSMDSNYYKEQMAKLSKQKIGQSKKFFTPLKGCGYSEAMCSLVRQIMKPCQVIPKTVNIETIAIGEENGFGADGNQILNEIVCTLKNVGVLVHCFIPSATVQQIERMPSAALNIALTYKWANDMKELFGTPFLFMKGNGRYSGLDGICNFYYDIGNALNISGIVESYIKAKRENVIKETEKKRSFISSHKALLISSNLQGIPYLIEKYKLTYGFDIVACNVIIKEADCIEKHMSDDVVDGFLERIKDSLKKHYPNCHCYIGKSVESDIYNNIHNADIILGTYNFKYEKIGIPIIVPRYDEIIYTFESYIRSVNNIYYRLITKCNHENLLLNNLKFEEDGFPLVCEKTTYAAKKVWQKMRFQRGQKNEL